MTPIIVSYYTRNTPYVDDAQKLKTSCEKFDLEYDILPISSRGNWESNCAAKPEMARLFIERHPNRPIFMLDVDCHIKGIPPTVPADFALCINSDIKGIKIPMECIKYRRFAHENGGLWLSGIMSFRSTPGVKKLLNCWRHLCKQDPLVWDQIQLQKAAIKLSVNCKTSELVSFTSLDHSYFAGGSYFGHHSAYHRYIAKEEPQKWLLIGSAPDAQEWWDKHGEWYKKNRWFIGAMNNAWRVPGDDLQAWFRPNDFNGERPQGDWFFENPDGWKVKPYWEKEGRLSFLDICYHLLNQLIYRQRKIILHVAGSDMIYPNEGPTHFYGTGPADPYKYGEKWLRKALARLLSSYQQQQGCYIFNASDAPKTMLPFLRVNNGQIS